VGGFSDGKSPKGSASQFERHLQCKTFGGCHNFAKWDYWIKIRQRHVCAEYRIANGCDAFPEAWHFYHFTIKYYA